MAYVRRILFERQDLGGAIRRYEVETPRWHVAWDTEVRFPRLVEVELRISQQCADYFRKVPYSLAETIWVQGLQPACFTPFCCGCEYAVLSYPREPVVRTVTKLAPYHTGLVVLEVALSPDTSS